MSDQEKFNDPGIYGNVDYINFNKEVAEWCVPGNGRWRKITSDPVNSPAHYTRGGQEAIDTIEEAIQDAPSPVEGMLQAQALKYLLRMWLKDKPEEDAKKAQWYLNRLINKIDQDC